MNILTFFFISCLDKDEYVHHPGTARNLDIGGIPLPTIEQIQPIQLSLDVHTAGVAVNQPLVNSIIQQINQG